MKKIGIGLLIIFLLINLNVFDILSFFYNKNGIRKYENLDYNVAYQRFKTSDKLRSSSEKKYNIANNYYKQGNFQDALTFYNYALSENKSCEKNQKSCFLNYHNIGNTYYRLGEANNEINQKIAFRNQAISNYEKALELKYDQETKENLDFVKNKIKKKESQEQESGNEGNQQNKQENLEEQSGTGNTETSKGQENGTGSQENQASQLGNEGNEQSQTTENLSEQQKSELQNYIQYLQQEELNNQKYFNKKSQNSDQNDIFSQFFGSNTFFDNGDLNNDGKKDW